jgi:hypothetical protein
MAMTLYDLALKPQYRDAIGTEQARNGANGAAAVANEGKSA